MKSKVAGFNSELDTLFSGDENYGQHLDFNPCYLTYLNLKGSKRLKYLQYLLEFDRFKDYNMEFKSQPAYPLYQSFLLRYISQLVKYMLDFYGRAQPLFNLQEFETESRAEFESHWKQGTVPCWEKKTCSELFCVYCKKEFAKSTVFDAHLAGKKHQKAVSANPNPQKTAIEIQNEVYETQKPLIWSEFWAWKLAQTLLVIRDDTRAFIERKQTLTEKERVSLC
jgi:splicing factor 3A subunit 3